MDIKARSKAVNIIFSVLILVITSAMFACLYAPQLMRVNATEMIHGATTESLVMECIEYFKHFTDYSSSGFPIFVTSFCTYAGYFLALVISFIIYLVNYVIIIVQTIRGLCGKDVNKSIMRRLLMMITAISTYVAYVLGIYHSQTLTIATTIGIGPLAMILGCILLFVLCAIIRVSYEDNRGKGSRVLKVLISLFAFIASFIALASVFATPEMTYNMAYMIFIGTGLLSSTTGGEFVTVSYGALIVSGCGLIFAAQSTFSKLILHSFGFEKRRKDEKPRDNGTSLIVRSILALVFTGAGLACIYVPLMKVFPVTPGIPYYSAISGGLAFISLILAIIHKCISGEIESVSNGATPKKAQVEIEPEPEEEIELVTAPKLKKEPEPEEEPEEEVASLDNSFVGLVIDPESEAKIPTPNDSDSDTPIFNWPKKDDK